MDTSTHLTTAELAERWHCSMSWLQNQRSENIGPQYVKIGTKVLYPVTSVLAYEADRLVTPA